MLLRKKTLVLFICFFMIAFKAAAGSIFIQTAIERAEIANSYANGSIAIQAQNIAESADDKEPVHTLYLMSHVTATFDDCSIAVFSPPISTATFTVPNEALFTQNFPDSAFKPPKAKA